MSRFTKVGVWRLIVPLLLLTTAVAAASTSQDTATVSIYSTGFVVNDHDKSGERSTSYIKVGDNVRWHNADRNDRHQVVFENGLASPVLKPGDKWASPAFGQSGRYEYYDGRNTAKRGLVVVAAAPAPAATVTLSVSNPIVTFSRTPLGQAATLFGRINRSAVNEEVLISYRRYDQPAFSPLKRVLTSPDGSFGWNVRPGVRTIYRASWRGAGSGDVVVQVRPRVDLVRTRISDYWTIHVAAQRSMRGRLVQIQQQTSAGGWRTVLRVQLGFGATQRFRLPLSRGTHVIRAAISVNQAGAGYLAGFSRNVVWRKTS